MPKEILQDIIQDFSPEKFTHFFRLKNRSFRPDLEPQPYYDDQNFRDCLFIGEIPFETHSRLGIYSFHVPKSLTERSGKKAQYEKGKRILKDTNSDAGIFVFYDSEGNFRFSLITVTYSGTKRQFSHFKRYTYFVSPAFTNKTFLKQIGEADFSSIDSLKEAFSVEKVTKEFYQEIANWYFWALKHSKFPPGAEEEPGGRNIALIRLLTRLIFIWFMKHKGIVPNELFDYNTLKSSILKDLSPEKSTFYKAILQNLFFATLNTPPDERKFRDPRRFRKGYNTDFGNQYVYRYHNLFKHPDWIEEYFGGIPFLNGGLFECLDDRRKDRYIDGFTERSKKYQP
ncbi:MAG: class I SAM-dependent DNA methyltransferase, partial [Nitrospirae bacterium]